VLAPRTLAALHTHVGDKLALSGSSGTATFTISGAGLVVAGPHNSYADGGWMTSAGYQSLFSGFKYHEVMITMAPGDQSEGAEISLAARIEHGQPGLQTLDVEPADPPEEITELRQVTVLPVVLGVFLALLAAGAVGHALVTMTRRHATDIAILRTLGLTRPNCRLILATQATVLAVTGLIFGIPAGLVAGRTVWHVVASYTPVQYVPPLAPGVLLAVAPGAILLAGLLAAWPGHRAVHLQITQILRAE
jgi:predicted lysophospholipase L1 biosynthesis ABC-type transport system permease subunit